jgi:hypothetical protein
VPPEAERRDERVDPKEIFDIIIKADERLKVRDRRETARCGTTQARELLGQALEAARGIGKRAYDRSGRSSGWRTSAEPA